MFKNPVKKQWKRSASRPHTMAHSERPIVWGMSGVTGALRRLTRWWVKRSRSWSVSILSMFSIFLILSIFPWLKLVFRGSYFLLLIGSRRPPRRKARPGLHQTDMKACCTSESCAVQIVGRRRRGPQGPSKELIGNSLLNSPFKKGLGG